MANCCIQCNFCKCKQYHLYISTFCHICHEQREFDGSTSPRLSHLVVFNLTFFDILGWLLLKWKFHHSSSNMITKHDWISNCWMIQDQSCSESVFMNLESVNLNLVNLWICESWIHCSFLNLESMNLCSSSLNCLGNTIQHVSQLFQNVDVIATKEAQLTLRRPALPQLFVCNYASHWMVSDDCDYK